MEANQVQVAACSQPCESFAALKQHERTCSECHRETCVKTQVVVADEETAPLLLAHLIEIFPNRKPFMLQSNDHEIYVEGDEPVTDMRLAAIHWLAGFHAAV